MSASVLTKYYGLSQFQPNDIPSWQGDYNRDMSTIDKAIHDATITMDEKQDKLVSGKTIKTVNGKDLLGEGDIEIQAGDPLSVDEFNKLWEQDS